MAIVYKTLGSEFLDEFYGGTTAPLAEALRRGSGLMRDNPAHLSGAAQSLEDTHDLPEKSATELDEYWLEPTTGPFVGKNVERVMRLGYEQAIDLASKNEPEPKPIETFFVTGGGDDFEVHICEGKHAVTVFMFLPYERSYGSKRASSKSWVVRLGGLRERGKREQLENEDVPVVKTQVSGAKD